MLKRPITFDDFNDEKVTETHYFNLSKSEMLEMEVEYDGGFARHMMNIIEAKDNKVLVALFKDIILRTYGKKSEDGKSFIKNEQVREEFSHTAAFQAFFMELASDSAVAAEFIIGVVPKDMRAEVTKEVNKSTAEIAAGLVTPTA